MCAALLVDWREAELYRWPTQVPDAEDPEAARP
jgi:hypothetical protein